jgi:hypothetical protein
MARRVNAGRRNTALRRKTNVKVHNLSALDDEHLYAITQTTDEISDGDVFVEAWMGVVGFMYSYSPIAVTVNRGGEGRRGIDSLRPHLFSGDAAEDLLYEYEESIRTAVGEVKRLGLPIRPEYETLMSREGRRCLPHRRTAVQYDEYGYPLECLYDGSRFGPCQGGVELFPAPSGTGTMIAYCPEHYGVALERDLETQRRYPYHAPSDFDPSYAGERWDDDY